MEVKHETKIHPSDPRPARSGISCAAIESSEAAPDSEISTAGRVVHSTEGGVGGATGVASALKA